MTKKDYVKIAAVLARWRGLPSSDSIVAAVTLELATVFAADNPRFDKDRFFHAASGAAK